MGLPFLPVKAYYGSDYVAVRPDLKQITDPFTGRRTILVPPIRPDFCLIHGFAADKEGNVLIPRASDGDLAARAADKTIVSVERLVADLGALQRPDMKRLPAIYVHAVVDLPGGAAPTGCPGGYGYDAAKVRDYAASVKEGRLQDWLEELADSPAKGEAR